jgi:hypothetical protein
MFPEVNRVTGQIRQCDWRRARAKLLEQDPGPRTCRTGGADLDWHWQSAPRSHSSSSCRSDRTPWPVDQARWAKAWESKISATPGTGWLKSMKGGNRVLSSCLKATSNGSVEAAKVRFPSNGSVPSM